MKRTLIGFCVVVLMLVAWTGLAERQTERFTFPDGSTIVQHKLISEAETFSKIVSADKRMEVHFLNVGQGDCILILCPNGKRILVDGGSSTKKFDPSPAKDYLVKQLGSQQRIDALVITHPDKDHYNILPDILEDIDIGHIYLTGKPNEYRVANVNQWLREFPASDRTILTAKKFNTKPPKKLGDFGEAQVVVLAANVDGTGSYSETNTRSIVLKVSFGTIDILLAGDATLDTEADILERVALSALDVECLKVGHHGSRTSTGVDWVKAVKPEVAVVLAGEKIYGHPTHETIQRLEPFTATADPHRFVYYEKKGSDPDEFTDYAEAIYATSKSGNIVAVTEGKAIDITYDN